MFYLLLPYIARYLSFTLVCRIDIISLDLIKHNDESDRWMFKQYVVF